ncbi:MFS transporter [Amycolatopsis sp. WAC 01376]|uniref:MFS transporter n=1 Tax=Amycolatopsis sp. WAC 01376 TaxID=2203195 RepID=UPI000F76FA49|nr:MFS transporter [Amycolatopsis sp. WAC 01376]RSM66557.1 MFS transporter [Amycolatopsis sp. WAC 01376]
MRSRVALLVALGIDNFGSGLFLPLGLVFVIRVVGLPLAQAGAAVTLGAFAGLLVPALAGRIVDLIGPRTVMICSHVLQAAGASAFLLADGFAGVVGASVMLAAGQQLFYSSQFSLIADVAGEGPKDRPFAEAAMVRSAGFGLAGAAAAGLLVWIGRDGLYVAVMVDVATFVVAAAILSTLVTPVPRRLPRCSGPARVWRNRPYLALIVFSGLFALTMDFFLIGMPVYVFNALQGPRWLPGAIIALLTVVTSLGGVVGLRLTRNLTRIAAMRAGSALFAVWCLACLVVVFVPKVFQPVYLLGATLVLAAGDLAFGPRSGALAEAAAPPEARGRYLAAFQYAFTLAAVIAPAVVALFSVAVWIPWVLVAACACTAVVGLGRVGPRLPAEAVSPTGG